MKKLKSSSGLKELTIASACFGAIPLVGVLSDGQSNPLLFSAVWLLVSTVGLAAYTYFGYRELWARESRILLIKRFFNLRSSYTGEGKMPSVWNVLNTRSWLLPYPQIAILLLLWALRYVDSVVGAVIFECWPTFFALLMSRLNKGFVFTRTAVAMSIVSFVSVGIVVWSSNPPDTASAGRAAFIFGVSILIFTILLTLQDAPRYQQGIELEKHTQSKEGSVIFLTMLSNLVGFVIAGVALLILEVFGFFEDFTQPLSLQQIAIIIVGTLIVVVVGTKNNVEGTMKGKNLRVQIIRYSTPIFGVLFLVSLIPITGFLENFNILIPPHTNVRWGWLVIGLAGITASNIVANVSRRVKIKH